MIMCASVAFTTTNGSVYPDALGRVYKHSLPIYLVF
jgi:hypothetical protein